MTEQLSPSITLAQLRAWLHDQAIDTTQWGMGDAKAVCDLWTELQLGESTLHTDPPLRSVRVVEVIVRQNGQLLIEREQQFADGRVRARNRPPSEKMHPGELPVDAARRCLVEELNLTADAIHIAPQSITPRRQRDDSGSYPNLTTEYLFYTVVATVVGLPTTSFTIANTAHVDGDPILAHSWAWVQA